MKLQKPLRKTVRLVCVLLFLAGCAAYVSASAAKLQAPPEAPGRTRTPPGLARKTATPTRKHLPPGLAKKTPTATPTAVGQWTGSVLIEGGSDYKWGCAGQTISIRVEFAASSPFGTVNEMRVRGSGFCVPETEMQTVSWEPFAPLKIYPFTVPPNWIPYYVNAQYRDEYGNLSPVYCDDFHVEGMYCPITGTP